MKKVVFFEFVTKYKIRKGSITMNIFHNRPLFLSCMFFLLFSAVGYFIPSGYKLLLISVLLLLTVIFVLLYFILKKFSKYALLCVVLSSLLSVTAIISSYVYFDVDAKEVEKYHDYRR